MFKTRARLGDSKSQEVSDGSYMVVRPVTRARSGRLHSEHVPSIAAFPAAPFSSGGRILCTDAGSPHSKLSG